MSSKSKHDFAKFPSKYPATVRYSAVSHVRGHLHMSRLRTDKFYILTGKGPEAHPRQSYDIGIWEWTMEDQRRLVERALSETPMIEVKRDEGTEAAAVAHGG